MIKEKKEVGYLIQMIPMKYNYLTKTNKIRYKGINLKTDYLINLIHEFMSKYYFHKPEEYDRIVKINVWSIILKKKYGAYYNLYMDYLIEHDFIQMESDYFRSKKARTYKLIRQSILYIKHVKITDKILIRKYSREYLEGSQLTINNSPIPLHIRKKLVDDLYNVNIKYDEAFEYLQYIHKENAISYNSYQKNRASIEAINIKYIYFSFDEYGRMHTNYTVLKKSIRKNFISFNGEEMCEEDIINSQPFFLAILMKNTLNPNKLFTPEMNRYISLVKNGLIYEELMLKCGIDDRDEVKKMMYKVLFGKNNDYQKYNKMFYNVFPNVYNFIKEYKDEKNNYKSLSHALQILESKFIFNTVIQHIIDFNPEIKIITIHDSICYPIKYKKEVKEIFEYHQRKLLEDTTEF